MVRNRKQWGLRIEGLESRQMMAGDVHAYAISRILYITGDVGSNGVEITASGDNINVIGISQGGSATTVNHGASQSFFKIKDVVVALGKGDDALVATNLNINGSLYAQMSDGNDVVGLGQFNDPNNLIDDAVNASLGALSVKKSITLDLGIGDDVAVARAVSALTSISVIGGNGNDTVTFDNNGNPGDPGYVAGTVTKAMVVGTGIGNDTVTLSQVAVAKNLTVGTSNDNDTVALTRVSAKSMTVSLGSGDDSVSADHVTIVKTADYGGDAGTNTFADLGGDTYGKLKKKNFV